jgi:hypothetical protein
MRAGAVGKLVDAYGDDVVERKGDAGDNATSFRRRPATITSGCGTWGRARDEQNGADLR